MMAEFSLANETIVYRIAVFGLLDLFVALGGLLYFLIVFFGPILTPMAELRFNFLLMTKMFRAKNSLVMGDKSRKLNLSDCDFFSSLFTRVIESATCGLCSCRVTANTKLVKMAENMVRKELDIASIAKTAKRFRLLFADPLIVSPRSKNKIFNSGWDVIDLKDCNLDSDDGNSSEDRKMTSRRINAKWQPQFRERTMDSDAEFEPAPVGMFAPKAQDAFETETI